VRRGLALLALALAFPATATAKVHLVDVGHFVQPVYVASPPGDAHRLFVVERAGRIVVVRSGRRLRRPFLDLRGEVSTRAEQGLLSVAFAPDYRRSGRFYVDFTDSEGDIQIQEFRRSQRSPDRADRGTRRRVLEVEHSRYPHHIGGQLQFGPDGLLYIGVGDGGGVGDPSGHAQAPSSPLGKLLRIEPRVPGASPQIYAYGLRNPWRFSFDRLLGDLVIGDVGQDKYEEIDFEPRGAAPGANFGWNIFEGDHRYKKGNAPGAVPPVLELPHSRGFCAVVGGYVVRDRSLGSLYGRYVYGDDCAPRIYSVSLSGGRASADRVLMRGMQHVVSFGEDARGRVYVVSLNGSVYRLAG
jgi:glucose/arabinose dehydrogenase